MTNPRNLYPALMYNDPTYFRYGEDEYQKILDRDVSRHDVRASLAVHLYSLDDPRGLGYMWMARRHKWPVLDRYCAPRPLWTWRPEMLWVERQYLRHEVGLSREVYADWSSAFSVHSELPQPLFNLMQFDALYPTRREAEDALARQFPLYRIASAGAPTDALFRL